MNVEESQNDCEYPEFHDPNSPFRQVMEENFAQGKYWVLVDSTPEDHNAWIYEYKQTGERRRQDQIRSL